MYILNKKAENVSNVSKPSEELHNAGFIPENFYGNISGARYETNSKTLCVVARKQITPSSSKIL